MKSPVCLTIFMLSWLPQQAWGEPGRMVELTLRLTSNKQVTGQVVEYDDQSVVLTVNGQIATFTWDDIETSSAYQARKMLLANVRGSERNLTAEDHFQLGLFLAMRNRVSAAVSEFRIAEARDPQMKPRIEQAWREVRWAKERNQKRLHEPIVDQTRREVSDAVIANFGNARPSRTYTAEQHQEAIALYRGFGAQVRQTMAPDLVLLETRHFLIWTDWPESSRNMIPDWAEQMYSAMCDELGFARAESIWLGKCPVFCFSSKTRFDKFATMVDGYTESTKALGYTKTTGTGYVHVVLRRLGKDEAKLDQFATTMVHETSHAFMHCYISNRTLPAWLSEGLADYAAERVLNNRCQTGEDAATVARYYVELNKPIGELFEFESSPPAEFYPIAHSLVLFLIQRDRRGFVQLINDLKEGVSLESSLARRFKGMTLKTLERDWRAYVRRGLGN